MQISTSSIVLHPPVPFIRRTDRLYSISAGVKDDLCIERSSVAAEAHPVCGALRRRELNPIKQAYNPSRPAPLTDWVSMSAKDL